MTHSSPFSSSGRFAGLFALALLLSGCSIRSMAVNKVGDALAETGTNFASDEDPELVGDAIPFGLKTMEGLLESSPKHEGLLLAASSGFVQYAYGWVQMEGDMVEAKDLARATELRERARKLYLRARGYGLRGLEVDFPGLARGARPRPEGRPRADEEGARAAPLLDGHGLGRRDVAQGQRLRGERRPADRGGARPPRARARRGLGPRLDPRVLRELGVRRARRSAARSRRPASTTRRPSLFSKGRRAFPYLTYAESVSVAKQDKAQFQELLEKALAIDVSRPDDQRLANLLAQKRARWQLGRLDELFIE